MLDKRNHFKDNLYGSADGQGAMSDLQGPALLAYDSAVFRPQDLDGLFAFGWGSKKHDPTKTGKFGNRSPHIGSVAPSDFESQDLGSTPCIT